MNNVSGNTRLTVEQMEQIRSIISTYRDDEDAEFGQSEAIAALAVALTDGPMTAASVAELLRVMGYRYSAGRHYNEEKIAGKIRAVNSALAEAEFLHQAMDAFKGVIANG